MDTFAELVEELRGHGREIRTDSREVRPGDVFVALRGSTEDGAAFIPAALAAGAGVIVCEPRSSEAARRGNACVIVCEDTHTALCLLAQAAYRTDALPFPLIGVTGTNGKRTIVFLLEHLFTGGGKKSGILGTIMYRWPGVTRPAPLTTPGNLDLHRMLDEMRDAGVDVAIMEVSSHAVDQDRLRGSNFYQPHSGSSGLPSGYGKLFFCKGAAFF